MVARIPTTLIAWIAVQFVISLPLAESQATDLKAFNDAFKRIARTVTPTVVTITTKQTVTRASRGRRNTPFNPFFERPSPGTQEEEREGLGSGILMTEDGYILTNHHVAGQADQITVILTDDREFDGKLVGTDSLTDVAVIKIDASGLPRATVGNSDEVEIGEWVLAIGAPMTLRSTVTAGIVSAMGRNIDILRDNYAVEDFIQTDAAINPGNSGGALVNLDGEIIGMNTAIATLTRGFVGYGFAIPINLARKVMDDIVAYGRVRRGFLGVSLRDVDAGIADAFGLEKPQGVLIAEVLSDTPAEMAGLKSEDIILRINDKKVNRPNQVQSVIAQKHPEDVVSMLIRRGSGNLAIEVKLGERERQASLATRDPVTSGEAAHYGLTVQNLTSMLRGQVGLAKDVEGVIVMGVAWGPARDARFMLNDVIFKVRQGRFDQDIRSIEDFETALSRLEKGRNAAFSIRRQNVRTFLTMKIPE